MLRMRNVAGLAIAMGCLLMSVPATAKAPRSLADIHVTADDGEVSVVLAGGPFREHRTLGADPSVHLDPLSTMLEPHLAKGAGRVVELTGYRLSSHHDPGDTIVTYVLLLEVPPSGTGAVQAIWWEDHREVPTRLYSGAGTLGEPHGGGQMLDLVVTGDDGVALHLDGIVRLR